MKTCDEHYWLHDLIKTLKDGLCLNKVLMPAYIFAKVLRLKSKWKPIITNRATVILSLMINYLNLKSRNTPALPENKEPCKN